MRSPRSARPSPAGTRCGSTSPGSTPLTPARWCGRSAGDAVADDTADAWQRRAAGNPFFLVELARLAEPDVAEVPATVRDVVTRRLTALPERALDTLRLAAVVGRRFQAATVAAGGGLDADDVLDDLEHARVAGLVVEEDAGDYSFAHALTRDAVHQSAAADPAGAAARPGRARAGERRRRTPRARRRRADRRARAALAGRRTEPPRPGLARGPGGGRPGARAVGVPRGAWRSAPRPSRRTAAVPTATRCSASSCCSSWRTTRRTPPGGPRSRRRPSRRWRSGGRWARPERVAEAAATLTRYCVWLPHEPEAVFEDVIDDLRWALAHVADGDHATRAGCSWCWPSSSTTSRTRRPSGGPSSRAAWRWRAAGHDPALLWWACRTAWMGAWSPHLLDVREPWAAEGLGAARQAGDPAGVAVITLVMALDALERADLAGWTRLSEEAGRLADRERLPYVSISLQWLRMTLAGLRGDRAGVAREHAAMSETAPQVAIPMKDAQAPAAELLSRIWDRDALSGKVDELLAAFRDMFGTATVTHVMLARAGRVEEVRPLLARSPMPAEVDTYWSTINDWVFETEAAVLAEDRALATLALERLRPYAGRLSIAGASAVSGPVDGYLALLEAFVGDPAAATRSADAALATADEWGFAAYADWLLAWRDTLGF